MLKINNIKKQYDQFTLNCSLEVKPGCVVGLIGQNGAGKSTLFKAILNLISIDSGDIAINGKDYKLINSKDKQDIGVVLSDAGFSEYLKIRDIIPIMNNLYSRFEKADFMNQCQKFNLPLDKKIMDFSTGMKAKLKTIVAMSHQAKLLILDEPTSGLDVIARDELLDMLREYLENHEDHSIIISSHISGDLEALCDEIYMIDAGSIILHEDTDVLLSEYCVLKIDDKQFETIDKQYILRAIKQNYGYECLTNQKQYYMDNYKDIVVEKGNIDSVITLMIRGEKL